jgi:2,3-bisphosphoglycerate-dependent phosphoglycerate mutase
MGATRVWLIRHGESESNAGLPGSGPSDTPLTRLGLQQAEQVAEAFPEPPALIVTSPFLRAWQTAQPTIARFPAAAVQEWPVQEFTYLGDLHGQATTGRQREPYARAYWEQLDPRLVNGDAESFADLIDRVRECLDRLDRHSSAFIAVFTHGTFTRALLWSLATGTTDLSSESMRHFRAFAETFLIPNGCIVELQFPGPRVVAGSTAHLWAPTSATAADHAS